MFSILNLAMLSFQLFNPSIRLNSGKQLTLVGEGPPVVFSSGLFNTMPRSLYNNFIDNLKKNVTIVSINDFSPLSKNDIYDIATSLNVDSVSYISHSSFNPEVLESDKINKAMLIDPICLPQLNFGALNSLDVDRPQIDVKFPVMIFKAEKLYEGLSKGLPKWQDPTINGLVCTETINNVGHPDILDDVWADVAKNLGFWETAQGDVVDFKEWKFVKSNNIKSIRKDYRNYVAQKCLDFIHTAVQNLNIVETEVKELESIKEVE